MGLEGRMDIPEPTLNDSRRIFDINTRDAVASDTIPISVSLCYNSYSLINRGVAQFGSAHGSGP
jgi:hypothetical protein